MGRLSADFGLRGCKVYTSGKLEDTANKNKNYTDSVIIIDEAHRYRNENTEAYGFLHQLCAGNQIIVLSATPFNNRPEDIFSLIKLFQIPAILFSRIHLCSHLKVPQAG